MILAPLVRDRKGEHKAVFEDIRKAGFVRVRVDGQIFDLDEEIQLEAFKLHTIEAIVDRLVIRQQVDTPPDELPENEDTARLADRWKQR